MSRIVVLSTIYINMPSANGICARNIVSGLKDLGHSVDVVCYHDKDNQDDNEIDGVYGIEEKRQPRDGIIAKLIRTCRRLPGVFTKDASKFLDENLVNSYYEELCRLNSVRQVDAIVAMFFPIEGLQAAYLFKNKYSNVKVVDYELDSVGDGIANGMRQIYYNSVYEHWLKNIYNKIDSIIVMESHKEYWENAFYEFKDKVQFADIPVLVRKKKQNSESIEKYSMIYSGIIEKQYRSPTYLLDTLICLKNKIEFSFEFYSRGDCEEEIELASQKYHGIKRRGFVTPEELDAQINKAEFLVSIGNSISRSVPSKLISYISYGKPIIHFSSQRDDICAEYLRHYPLCLIIDQSKSVEHSADTLYKFLKENSGESIDFDMVRQFFKKNDPAYSAKVISSIVSRV